MNFKEIDAPSTTSTVDFRTLEATTGNIYESIAIVAQRSHHIFGLMRKELLEKVEEFKTTNDNLEEIFENNEQIEVSKFYERLPKPFLIALDEMKKGELEVVEKTDDQ